MCLIACVALMATVAIPPIQHHRLQPPPVPWSLVSRYYATSMQAQFLLAIHSGQVSRTSGGLNSTECSSRTRVRGNVIKVNEDRKDIINFIVSELGKTLTRMCSVCVCRYIRGADRSDDPSFHNLNLAQLVSLDGCWLAGRAWSASTVASLFRGRPVCACMSVLRPNFLTKRLFLCPQKETMKREPGQTKPNRVLFIVRVLRNIST